MPRATMYPAITGAQGPMPAIQQQDDGTGDDPTAALQSLLAGQYTPPAPQTTELYGGSTAVPSGAMRNSALTQAIRTKYGLGTDVGDISQEDLQNLDQFVRSGDLSDKIAASTAPEQVKGQYGLQETGMKTGSAERIEAAKGATAAEIEQQKAAAALDVARQKAGASVADPATISFQADQTLRDPSTLTRVPAANKQAIWDELAKRGVDVNNLSNQTKQMSETANVLLNPAQGQAEGPLDQLIHQAEDMNSKGQFNILASPVRQFFVNHGASSLLGLGDDAAQNVSQFETRLGVMQKEIQRGLAGARGASNTAMNEQFQKLFNAKGDIQTFRGEAEAMRSMLAPWAATGHYAPTNMGATVGAPTAGSSADYSNPNYQPR